MSLMGQLMMNKVWQKDTGMFLCFVFVTVLGGSYAHTIYQQSTQTLAKTYKKIGEEQGHWKRPEPSDDFKLLMGYGEC